MWVHGCVFKDWAVTNRNNSWWRGAQAEQRRESRHNYRTEVLSWVKGNELRWTRVVHPLFLEVRPKICRCLEMINLFGSLRKEGWYKLFI